MTTIPPFAALSALSLGVFLAQTAAPAGGTKAASSMYDFTVQDIDGKDVLLSKYKGQVCLIVNVASR